MPEVYFEIQLPDGSHRTCYSPSSVVKEHFKTGEEMTLSDFQIRSRQCLMEASERVRRKFGYGCSAASAQLEEIERFTDTCPPGGIVRILRI